jgi:hypothetical protein
MPDASKADMTGLLFGIDVILGKFYVCEHIISDIGGVKVMNLAKPDGDWSSQASPPTLRCRILPLFFSR